MRQRPKVLFFVRRFSGGGAERVTATLCNYFARNGIDTFVCELDGYSGDYCLDGRVERSHVNQTPIRYLNIAKKMSAVNAAYKKINPDCVVALGSVCRYLKGKAAKFGAPIVLSERNYPDLQFSAAEKDMFENIYDEASAVVFQTPEAMACFRASVQQKGVLIPNPVMAGLPVFSGERKHTVVTFARLEPQKNLGLLVEAFAVFHARNEDWRLEIYGNGSQRECIQNLISKNNLDNCAAILPFSSAIHDLIVDAGMFVTSSDFEGLQNSFLEALVMGIPCVATDCLGGGARLISKNGERALLVPRGNVEALAHEMMRVSDDCELCQQLSEAGKMAYSEFSEDTICTKWLDLVLGVIGSTR